MSTITTGPIFRRAWAMPSPDTFTIGPIADLLARHLHGRCVIVDPFARNSRLGTVTNDLNPETSAQSHVPADQFVTELANDRGVFADAVLFDPPYSPRQISEVYARIGRACGTEDTQNARLYRVVKDGLAAVLKVGGIAICCGWNSSGFGPGRGFELMELLTVCHGSAHNDTIVTVEWKTATLFDQEETVRA